MLEPLWDTIEVRIVCLETSVDLPKEISVPNIFTVVSFDELINGSFFGTYQLEDTPKDLTSCGYPLNSFVRLKGTDDKEAPLFFNYVVPELEQPYFLVTGPAGGGLLFTPEDVFSRYNLELVYHFKNWDIIDLEQILDSENETMKVQDFVIDSAGRFIPINIDDSLPFVMRLQELGKENKAPKFDQSNTTLPGSLYAQLGMLEIIPIPPIVDPEGDVVAINVVYDGQVVPTSADSVCKTCYVIYNTDLQQI